MRRSCDVKAREKTSEMDSPFLVAFTTLAQENELYYLSHCDIPAGMITNAINFVIKNGIEGANKVYLSNFDLNNVFTGGNRPEIKRDYKILFGCLNTDMVDLSVRARQKFVTEEQSECVQISLLIHVIEIWCPGLVRDETLLNAHINSSILRRNRGSCSFSGLLSDAQDIVMFFRHSYRNSIQGQKKKLLEDSLEDSNIQKSEGHEVNLGFDGDAVRLDFSIPFCQDTIRFYEELRISDIKLSSEALHIIDYVCSHCEEGCRVLQDASLRVSNFFTSGNRPEIKKEVKILFGWLKDKELNLLRDRARQKFTQRSDADQYRYSLFLYIIELWRPCFNAAEVLQQAYIPITYGASKGILSSSLISAQRLVYEVRHDLKVEKQQENRIISKNQRKTRDTPHHYLIQNAGEILQHLRDIFMSKVKYIKMNAPVSGYETISGIMKKRKLQHESTDSGEGDDREQAVK